MAHHISFDFHRVALQKGERGLGSQVVLIGEVFNRSYRSFNAVSLRACVRNGERTIANTKRFSKSLDDLEYDQVVSLGTECECCVESAF